MSLHRRVGENEPWLSVTLAASYATLLAIHTGILTAGLTGRGVSGIFLRVLQLGWYNAFFAAGIMLVGLHIFVTFAGRSTKNDKDREAARRSTSALLAVVVHLLERQRRTVIVRALVFVIDKGGETRSVVCGANIRTDPEFSLTVPTAFGAAGRAISTRAAQTANIAPSDRHRDSNNVVAEGIWDQVACVLSFPLQTKDGRVFGVLNFDSNVNLADSGLGDRRTQMVLAGIADVVAEMMKPFYGAT
jgi:hypothetical protein